MSKSAATKAQLDAIRQHLAELAGTSPGVGAAVLMSGDGHAIATHQLDRTAAGKIAAMGSSLLALGEAFTREAGTPGMKNVLIESASGVILVMAVPVAGNRLVLAVIANDDATLGHLIWSTRQCCQAIAHVFDPPN